MVYDLQDNTTVVDQEISYNCSVITCRQSASIHNATTSNNLEDIVFYFKAKPIPDDFRFGSKDFWKFHQNRFNDRYNDPFQF